MPKKLKNTEKFFQHLGMLSVLFLAASVFVYVSILQRQVSIKTSYGVVLGDINNDGRVDVLDFQLLSNSFGKSSGQTGYNANADLNNDNTVNILDFQILNNNFGNSGTVTNTPTQRPSSPTPTPSGPTPTLPPPPPPGAGVWISQQQIMALPTTGTAWTQLTNWASNSIGSPTINNQDSDQDQVALAKAYTCARIGTNCTELATALNSLSSRAPSGDRALAWGRNISAWIIAADILINSGRGSGLNVNQFKTWANTAINTNSTSGGTVAACHENWRNNWGTMCGGSRIAVLAFLGNTSGLARAWDVFRGYVGDNSGGAYVGFNTAVECTNWRCPGACDKHWINPRGCTKNGRNFDGINPSEMYRQGDYNSSSSWPPPMGTTYPFNGLGGLLVQAEILSRKGYPAWTVADSAMLRAYSWMIDEAHWNVNNSGKQHCLPWLINKRYGRSYPAPLPATPGQNTGFCDWTFAR